MTDHQQVNYIRHLNAFFSQIRNDKRLKANDVSLYMALFQLWNQHLFRHQFPIYRAEVMLLSKIGSRSTYVSCLRVLHAYGYIIYLPSSRPYDPSRVSIIPFEETAQLSLFTPEKNGSRSAVENEPRVRPGNGSPAGLNNDPRKCPKVGHFNKQINNEKESQTTPAKKNTPDLQEAISWFNQKGLSAAEARKFFFHNQAIGWSLSGYPIRNWQAAAEKWIENIQNTADVKQGQLHTNRNKSYTTPL